MKCWLECSKLAESSEEYKETAKEKFKVNQPYWTEEMYQTAFVDVISSDYIRLFDPGYGISTILSDDNAAMNDTKEAVIPYIHSSVMKTDEDGTQYTWSALREQYKGTIDSELAQFNEEYHKFIGE